jgi:hypothetical protein
MYLCAPKTASVRGYRATPEGTVPSAREPAQVASRSSRKSPEIARILGLNQMRGAKISVFEDHGLRARGARRGQPRACRGRGILGYGEAS